MTRHTRLVLEGVLLAVVLGCGDEPGPVKQIRSKQGKYAEVVLRIRKGEITSNQDGVAMLPDDLSSASVGGQVYTCSGKNNLLLVAFKTWQGKGHNMEGFLFSSRALSPADLERDYYGNNTVVVGPVPLVIERHIDANWYVVSYRLD